MSIPVLVIFAPTASGKTALTLELFSKEGSSFFLNHKAEVISADSMAIYKFMDIGTAKPDKELQSKIPHHIVDCIDPNQTFSAADFVNLADEKCREIWERGNIPCVVGGTGFYIRSFLMGLPETPESNEVIRNQLKDRMKTEGREKLYAELKALDPESASKIHLNDEYRICRALEVYYTTGKKRSDFELSESLRDGYDFTVLILDPPRELLFDRIEKRVGLMMESGLKSEVEKLKAMGYTEESPGMRAIGYREWFNGWDDKKVQERIVHNTRIYAKKQFTFMRNIPGSQTLSYTASEEDMAKIKDLLIDKMQLICHNK